MATKKKVTPKAKKKVAPKKKVTSNKSITKKPTANKKAAPREEVIERDFETGYEEPPSPGYNPSPSSDETEAKSGNPVFKFLIIAGLILIAIFAYTQITKSSSESSNSPSDSSKQPEKLVVKEEVKPTEEAPKTAEAPKVEMSSEGLKGFALDKLESSKTYAEAVAHCNSLGKSLPSSIDLKAIKKANIPSALTNAVVWSPTNGTVLKFDFKSGKGQNVSDTEKLSVLCKD
ncbi:hypothetical protein [Leptospira sp. GIMC2001]|uniref:hypothetical protein n=1 Tax=Leptospira sp. GIMC2001 TaxID=1513297 RepID=UPI00234A08C4|nr:hypothetical protein [Leptospira sp. GIMC2001]WCL49807.1 hypothetical protein O4O04_03035 [Leptospira sp. GIMC2001]